MSISAPRMTIKSHSPWPLKAAFGVALIGLSSAIAFWAYDAGRSFTGGRVQATAQDVTDLNAKVTVLSLERDRFLSFANAAESQQNIAQATQAQLNKQITALELDNAKLKEDLAFFEGLLPTAIGNEGVAIQRLNLALVAPTQLRYRSLIMRGGNNGRDFVGDFQVLVNAVVRGKNVVLTYPEQNANPTDKAGFRLDFKYYQRIDGMVTLPEGTTIKTLQVKVLEKGQVRAQQSTHL
ncbi:DUF6776 family protein [Glaciimonas sp. PCH181]|uniref:DUF6776 family protein n=1 Tax=Glaciimonas sp. PCH181 TaxID=2133943 RepID=UPI000D3A303C|nr:DUF6776 family protein [Glaciimonas sp. PCH181]PUA16415.1 hypothetical protein C7W93_24190 [Glaciimonas sp. PCH181]